MATLEQMQSSIRDRFRQKSAWSALADSEMVAQMSDLLGALFYETLQEIESARSDSFLSLAMSRQAVLAHAADRGYVPPKPKAPIGVLRLENTSTTNSVTIPAKHCWLDNDGISYYTTEAITILPNAFEHVNVEQLTKSTLTVAGENTPYQEVRIADWSLVSFTAEVLDAAMLHHSIQQVENFWKATREDLVAELIYSVEDDWRLRFGNGEFGKLIPVTDNIELEIWTTNPLHQLLAGSQLYSADPIKDSANISVSMNGTVVQPIGKGYFRGTTERIRYEAQSYANAQQRMVWRGDYEHFLRTSLPDLNFVKVWGEHEEEQQTGVRNFENINKIFVSAWSPLNPPNLSLLVLQALDDAPAPLSVHYEFVPPEELTYSLKLEGVTPQNYTVQDFTNKVTQMLMDEYGKYSSKRPVKFESGGCYALLQNSDLYKFADQRTKSSLKIRITGGKTEPTKLHTFVYLGSLEYEFI